LKLEHLDCSDNQLSNIDVSNNPVLDILNCADNQLSYLDISHGNTNNIQGLFTKGNPDLYEIKVDKGFNDFNNRYWHRDVQTSYVE